MKFTTKTVISPVEILANDHYIAIPYDCSALGALATDGVIPAGTIIPANDASAKGILLNAVKIDEDPNGAIVIHGFVKASKLPVAAESAAVTALKQITIL